MNNLYLTLLGTSLATPFMAKSPPPPNIILFVVDDMGWQDTSLAFDSISSEYNRMYHTPHMEELAKRGMIFTQAYASSVSSPTRCSMLTGANAARHRVTNWTLHKDKPTDESNSQLIIPTWNYNGIAQVPNIPHTFWATSFAQILKDNGYHTIHCGKAHWGATDTPGENPHHFGFEKNIAGHAAGGLATYLGEKNYGNNTDRRVPSSPFAIPHLEKFWQTNTFATEALTQEAITALDKARAYNQPFFLHLSHYAIHIPIDRDSRFYQQYIDKGLHPKDAAYAALIEGVDKSLGDIIEYLNKHQLNENTIIMVVSDNGGFALEGHWRHGKPHTQNAPLRSGKGSAYEGGIRVPAIVYWKNRVKPNSKCHQYIIAEDFFPTILEMAQIKSPSTPQTIDGKSFVPLLLQKKNKLKNRSLVWNMPNQWISNPAPGIEPHCILRKGKWKLIYFYQSQNKELYNIDEDMSETKNLVDVYPHIVKKLSKELGKELRRMKAQRPLLQSTHTPVPWPDHTK